MTLHSSLPLSGGASESHPVETSAEALVASFAEADQHTVDLSVYGVEDWVCLGFFWAMAGLVFLQFFSRYVLNDSYAWTEELAVYCLMPVVFIGASMCVRRVRHVQVNLVYRYLPVSAGRVLSTAVDLAAITFYSYGAWLVARYALAVDNEPMTTINWNKSHVYWLAFAGFALMALRAVQVAVENWRRGFSALQNPGFFDGSTD
ncbi:MAG TPA: TRAP transporter permease DctQ [Rhodoferax sp.]|uniref:TRAP transporter small permease n=1 Tax=Rhodoferax sp. TaxID=50421 RepID=UPI0008BE5201|nr:TRAP transporter small permease [Rhodoferax sp.]OGO96649.1 MAG: ABC transporter permease [Curvibacter sp. GWA2_63_95]HCX82678.1 TRAP transporter permease DctQ [Rhodoferax sp.]